ncbi:hypothetical protein G3M48_010341 [Beauveria asiatica]|uniref:Uncharacterized protein n=1 Tax=Beauveria asiatica TaxID=1069075 RepID=A0AAW0S1B2_9HYPO
MIAFLVYGFIIAFLPSGVYTVLISKDPVSLRGFALNVSIGAGFIAGVGDDLIRALRKQQLNDLIRALRKQQLDDEGFQRLLYAYEL